MGRQKGYTHSEATKAKISRTKSGIVDHPSEVQAGSLYNNTYYSQGSFFPRMYYLTDSEEGYTESDRITFVGRVREGIASSGMLNQAINQKANWAFSPTAWDTVYTGDDKDWANGANGKTNVVEFINNVIYSTWNSRGPQWNFKQSLRSAGIATLKDGEIFQVNTFGSNNYPYNKYIHSDRIDSGNKYAGGHDIIKDGTFKGNRIVDGCILDPDTGRTVAYNVRGKSLSGEDDVIIPASACYSIFDPRGLFDRNRAVPPLACAITQMMHTTDIKTQLLEGLKIENSVNLVVNNASGQPRPSKINPYQKNTDGTITKPATPTGTVPQPIAFEGKKKCNVLYFKAGSGEDVQAFFKNNPGPNIQMFVKSNEKELCGALGWPWEVMNPNDSGGKSMEGIAENVRMEIDTFQNLLYAPFKLALLRKIAIHMTPIKDGGTGMLPDNRKGDWQSFKFWMPSEFSLNALNTSKQDQSEIKVGLNSLQGVCSKYGRNWRDIRSQQSEEADDLLGRAQKMSDNSGGKLSLEYCMNYFRQEYINAPVDQAPQGE